MNDHLRRPWHAKTAAEVLTILHTSEAGLSDAEAAARLKKNGPNELRPKRQRTIWEMLKEQLTDPMILILIGASVLSMVLNEWTEAVVILVIVALNATVSIIQEQKAASALEALKNLGAPTARVLREGEESEIPAKELVAGDIVFLEEGRIVPADLRLLAANNLKTQEASLTGESVPVEKDADTIVCQEAPLGDRANMAYSSAIITYGNGTGVVVETGMKTEVGQIANLLDQQDEYDTPLKRKLSSVGKTLSIVGLIVCIVIFIIGSLYGRPWLPLLMTAVSLAISVIPEGLPATVTIVMALGVQRMAEKNALVRKLPAVETLGGATAICCDKTGTLTQNKMTVTQVAMNGDFAAGQATAVEQAAGKHAVYLELVQAAALCNNASLDPDRPGEILGDPTEGALIFLTDAFGLKQDDLEEQYPRLFEQPFDSDRKRMTTVHKKKDGLIAYTKGAVDEMLPLCTHILTAQGVRPITDWNKMEIRDLCLKMSAEALRVLGFAMRPIDKVPEEEDANLEHELIFLGAVGMIDPPRKEVIQAVETCRQAGIRTIMITGDHKVTAMAIAAQLSIFRKGNTVLSGDELRQLKDDELDAATKTATVFARVSPRDKLRIVESLKRTGEIVAMTGDGVNDAPALKAAHIGVAMGKSGTDVAKDAAAMLLLDDNFTTIEHAIREGRRIYRNIQKVIQFLLAGNIAEILTLLVATLLNWDAPILAVHILLINLVTDSLPAIALGVDPASKNVMKRRAVQSDTLFERGLVTRVILHGIFIAAATIASYQIGLGSDGHAVGMTMAFLVLAVSQMFHALNQRSNTDSLFTTGNGHNRYLFGTMLLSGLIIALIVALPFMRSFFSLTVLTSAQWLTVLGLSLLPLALVETTKLIKRVTAKCPTAHLPHPSRA
jgi:Ca2+-transporting ATPase